MPTIHFSSKSYAKEACSPPAAAITLSHDTLVCGDEVFANFSASLWHVTGKLFINATTEGPVTLTFRGQQVFCAGPYRSVRFVGQHLFGEGNLLACVEQERWVCSLDNSSYEDMVVTDA
jgi:hypothetical protein